MLTGTHEGTKTCRDCDCSVTVSVPVTGTVLNETTAGGSGPAKIETCIGSGGCSCTSSTSGSTWTAILKDNGRILQVIGAEEYIRQ